MMLVLKFGTQSSFISCPTNPPIKSSERPLLLASDIRQSGISARSSIVVAQVYLHVLQAQKQHPGVQLRRCPYVSYIYV